MRINDSTEKGNDFRWIGRRWRRGFGNFHPFLPANPPSSVKISRPLARSFSSRSIHWARVDFPSRRDLASATLTLAEALIAGVNERPGDAVKDRVEDLDALDF